MTQVDTIVVGAGVAGLTAGRLLRGRGQSVIILEARDRVGGRTHSERRDGTVTDLGASWIHGITDSPVAAAADAFGMPTMEFTVGSYQPDSRPIVYFDPDGARLSPTDARRFTDDIRAVDDRLAGAIADSSPGTSYEDACETALRATGWPADRAERVREYLRHRSEEQYGVRSGLLDAHGLDDDAIEGDEVVFPHGYDALAARLADGLDVRLDHEVTRIAWDTQGVRIHAAGTVFDAEQAIVTVPVGVLKSDALRIEPPLPHPVAGALAGLEMNDFEKIFLRFDERFWGEGAYALRQQGPAGLWWHSFYDLTALHGVPTLLTFAAGPAAVAIRDWPDARIVDDVMRSLRRLFGASTPDPRSARITRWRDDPFARGSYAYMSVGARPEDHDLLATPVGGRLHLAGEATWTDDPATVTAALLSGHRAAQNVLGVEVPVGELWRETGSAPA